ncbi:ABC-type multidrug transport system ATPase subunit [Mobilisporobacter senegalensis]|uniref:ABC-type multidrug transport system ATPase subunit n=1 Tax=Mobilisporobacter senegalensis TaxID=1329262 RepID=A0A3N1Y0P5_9FIRM|nr:ABC transporter ATP-binding protein [Mobilisporobacter senegalensis]ROR30827.1 ABC-type multidrug transport system ATPase subunit [Mobilisporobacter senegalensis]
MITINNLTKRYGTFLANDGVNLEVKPGEVSILLGPNGAGKSTLIKCIAGLLKHQGEILICGQKNKSILAKQYLGYIPEMPALYDMLTIWEHMEFIGRAYKLKDWESRANQLFERLELDDKKNKLGSELSKGMQQKVSLCCGLLPNPKVLLFDEPLVGLDPHAIKELKNLIIEYRNEGTAILLSTHMLDSVAEFWDSTNIMMQGKIVAYRTRAEIESTGENLEELFFSITEKSKNPTDSKEAGVNA